MKYGCCIPHSEFRIPQYEERIMARRFSGPRRLPRAAFTMIELLVVIAILAVMVALLTAAVQRVRVVAKRTQAVADMAQLSNAVSAFKTDYGVTFVPSHIVLRERMDYNMAIPLEVFSLNYLKKVWPQLPLNAQGIWIDWNGDNINEPGPVLLEGDQCLVFFLGGIPINPTIGVPWTEGIPGAGTQGFGTNPANPSMGLGGVTKRYFEFQSNRLIKNANPAGTTSGFYSYADPFGTPYAFFSSNGTKNGYTSGGGGDCPTLMAAFNVAPANAPFFSPYKDSSGAFIQPTGFQIVCAGAKGNAKVYTTGDVDIGFGIGGLLQAGAFPDNGTNADGDNVTSFFAGPLSSYGITN
jgi:prepilin-type N-terminal cleavage/methylation domain-containing protein